MWKWCFWNNRWVSYPGWSSVNTPQLIPGLTLLCIQCSLTRQLRLTGTHNERELQGHLPLLSLSLSHTHTHTHTHTQTNRHTHTHTQTHTHTHTHAHTHTQTHTDTHRHTD